MTEFEKFEYLAEKYQSGFFSKEALMLTVSDISTECLVSIVSNPETKTANRELAIEMLFSRTGPEVDQILINAAKESSLAIRVSAIVALGARPGRLIDLALMQLTVGNPKRLRHEVCVAIFKALADRPGHLVTGFLMDCVWDDELDVLMYAIDALTNRPGLDVDQVLVDCAYDKRWNRHQGAFGALRTRPGALIDKTLIAASKNEGEFGNNDTKGLSNADEFLDSIRWAAAKAMAGRPGKNIDQALIRLSEDEGKYVRLAAIKSMSGRQGKDVKKALAKAAAVKDAYYGDATNAARRVLAGHHEDNDVI